MKTVFSAAIALGVLGTAAAGAQEPVENVSHGRHGNLAAAQDLARQSYDRLTAAQQANEFDMDGHASRAKDLLRQVNDEIRQAATAANRNGR